MRVNVRMRLGNCPHCGSKALVYYLPKGRHGFAFRIEEIFKEAAGMERRGRGVSFTVFPIFRDPIVWLMWINNFKELMRIQIGLPAVI